MKRHIRLSVLCLLCMPALLISCNDWLDVGSDTTIIEKDMFNKRDGFHLAVNGVYYQLSEAPLYGRNLSYGMVSVLGNNYDETLFPEQSYISLAEGAYQTSDAATIIENVWNNAYTVISQCNEIIKEAEKRDADFFRLGQMEKDMIIGEMLGVRAMLHLDMLCLFAPIPSLAGEARYIPYSNTYPDRQPEHLTVTDALGLITGDLARAAELLRKVDTEVNTDYISTYSCRMYTNPVGTDAKDIFYTKRGTRMNYFSATALLARAYQWGGEEQKAYETAALVYDFNQQNGWFAYTLPSNLSTSATYVYRKMPEDILMGGYNTKLYDLVEGVRNTSGKDFYIKNQDVLFQSDLDDYRYVNLISDDGRSLRWLRPTDSNIETQQGPLIPIIRMTEVAYIMSEYLLNNGRAAEAVEILNPLRLARGCKAELSADDETSYLKETLINEMTREYLSEGKTFYLYKRLNRPIFNGTSGLDMTGRYVLPMPDSETAYM